MPFRLCLMENGVLATEKNASDSSDVTSKDCCVKCDPSGRGESQKEPSECCIEVDQQPPSSALRTSEILPALSALELPVATLLTLEWIDLLRPTVANYPPSQELSLSPQGNERQAVLSIWTI